MKSLSPSAADLEIRSLSPRTIEGDGEGEGNELVWFVEALTARLRDKRDYEVVQAWMAVFLRLHGDEVLAVGEGLRDALREWQETAEAEGKRLGELVGYCGGVIGFLRAPR